MTNDLTKLHEVPRLLFEIPLKPVQGQRFQPTGFPGLGAATFQTERGACLLVESAQSMANRLEITCWDEARQDLRPELQGLSHVKVTRKGKFLTDTVLDAHRINSPYLLQGEDKTFANKLKEELGGLDEGPIDRRLLSATLLRFDIGSLIHGAFLAKDYLAGGRLRVARALSAFIEADGVRVAASGGVKNDHVNPQGDTKIGFGNVPFARDEFTAERLTLYVNIDLGQIRGYGLDAEAERLLIALSLFKVRRLLDGSLRLRTACDLEVDPSKMGASIRARRPEGFELPVATELERMVKDAIAGCRDKMTVTNVTFEGELKRGKEDEKSTSEDDSTSES
jgi:CRISPR-associated protein Csb1